MSFSNILDTLMRQSQPTSTPAAAAPAQQESGSNPFGFISKLKEAIPIKVGIGYGPMAASFSGGNDNSALLRKLPERQLGQGGGGVTQNPQPQTPVYKYEPLKMDPMSMNMTPGLYNPLAIR